MKQKVFVQGRETQSVYVMRDYIPPREKRNSFSEIGFSQANTRKDTPRKKGFHVRQMRDGTQFLKANAWKRKG
jgi:hypothetical protein